MIDTPTKLLINGELRDASAGAAFPTFDPAHGGELATVAQAGTDDVDAAVTAARGAFDGAWAKTAPAKRASGLLLAHAIGVVVCFLPQQHRFGQHRPQGSRVVTPLMTRWWKPIA